MLFRARIETVTAAGAWAMVADLGLVGPVDCIGTPTAGDAALLVRLDDTDMVLICRGSTALGELNAADFGATGDGVTDDTAALAAAKTAARESRHTLYIPAGSYRILEPLDLTDGFHSVRGDGEATEIIQHGVGVPVIRLGGAGNRISRVDLSQNAMPTSTGDAYRLGESGIEIDALYLSVIESVRIHQVSYGLVLPSDRARFCFSNTFRDLDILEVYGGAISIVHHPSSGSTGNYFQNVYCNGSYLETHDWPVKIQGVHDSYFQQLNIEGFTGGGMLLMQQAGAVFDSLHIEFDYLNDYYSSVVRLYDAANVTIRNMTVQNVDFGADGASGVTRLFSVGTDQCSLAVQGVRGLQNTNTNDVTTVVVGVEPNDCTDVEVHVDGITFYGAGFKPEIRAEGQRGVWSLASVPTAHYARRYQAFVTQPLTRYTSVPVDLQTVQAGTTGWYVVPSTTDSTISVAVDGKYMVDAGAKLRDLVDGETNLLLTVNGVNRCINGGTLVGRSRPTLTTVLSLQAGDEIGLSVYTESSGAPVIFESDQEDTWLAVTYVGP